MKFKIDNAFLPTRAHKHDAGLDLPAVNGGTIYPGQSMVFQTGVHVELPDPLRYVIDPSTTHNMPSTIFGLICPRSGMNVKHGIFCSGVIDEGYTGEILVRRFNFGDKPYEVEPGDKIAQMVVVPCLTGYDITLVNEMEDSERGENGFGSSGR